MHLVWMVLAIWFPFFVEFHPRLVGLTGSDDEIKKAAREYRVYYMKSEEEGSDYLVDHSIIMYILDLLQLIAFVIDALVHMLNWISSFCRYLMDPQMDYDVKGLSDGIIQEIKQYKSIVTT